MDWTNLIDIIKGLFGGMNFMQMISYIIAGAFIKHLLDKVFAYILGVFWPDKYLNIALNKIEEFDNKVLDKFKAKYPDAGAKLEKKITKFLSDAITIINN